MTEHFGTVSEDVPMEKVAGAVNVSSTWAGASAG
jgi:hypothetical protein